MTRFLKYASVPALFLIALGLNVSDGLSQQTGNPAVGASLYDGCVPCHGLNGKGLAGTPEDKLMTQMKNIQTGIFSDPKKVEMHRVMNAMNRQQLQDLAAYISKM